MSRLLQCDEMCIAWMGRHALSHPASAIAKLLLCNLISQNVMTCSLVWQRALSLRRNVGNGVAVEIEAFGNEAIEQLDERAAAEWKTANCRCFDIGYETNGLDQRWRSTLRLATLARAVSIGTSITFTAYPRDKSEQGETQQTPPAA